MLEIQVFSSISVEHFAKKVTSLVVYRKTCLQDRLSGQNPSASPLSCGQFGLTFDFDPQEESDVVMLLHGLETCRVQVKHTNNSFVWGLDVLPTSAGKSIRGIAVFKRTNTHCWVAVKTCVCLVWKSCQEGVYTASVECVSKYLRLSPWQETYLLACVSPCWWPL